MLRSASARAMRWIGVRDPDIVEELREGRERGKEGVCPGETTAEGTLREVKAVGPTWSRDWHRRESMIFL